MIFASTSFGQIIVRTDVSAAAPHHLGSGPIDRNNLSADILNCEVCRQRLGLPPLQVFPSALGLSNPVIAPKRATPAPTLGPDVSGATSPVPQAATGRMLGSPGMISSVTAEQMALQGFVVEEFKPPQPDSNAIQLGELPPEVRQQFLRSLELPFGARVMSAEVRGQKAGSVKVEGSETITAQKTESNSDSQSEPPKVGAHRSLGAPGIETVLETAAADMSIQTKPQPKPPTETAAPIPADAIPAAPTQSDSANELAKERENLKVQLEQMQFEWKKRLEQADAANKEVLTLLEKRTAEVTDLQLQLKSQREALTKAKQESQSKNKPEAKKKVPNKGKKPAKPSIDT